MQFLSIFLDVFAKQLNYTFKEKQPAKVGISLFS